MSELKAFNMPRYAGQFTIHEVYLKSEADKVIAEKDKEIAEKDKEIAKLKDAMRPVDHYELDPNLTEEELKKLERDWANAPSGKIQPITAQ